MVILLLDYFSPFVFGLSCIYMISDRIWNLFPQFMTCPGYNFNRMWFYIKTLVFFTDPYWCQLPISPSRKLEGLYPTKLSPVPIPSISDNGLIPYRLWWWMENLFLQVAVRFLILSVLLIPFIIAKCEESFHIGSGQSWYEPMLPELWYLWGPQMFL